MVSEKAPNNSRHSSSKQERGTPSWIVEPAREVLGGIDLDPASSTKANKIVKADFFYRKRDNGLQRPWRVLQRTRSLKGAPTSIWLNPPGGLIDGRGRPVMVKCTETGACGLKPGHTHEDVDSSVKRWWQKTVHEHLQSYFGHALFLSFSIEAMQVTQNGGYPLSILDFPTVVFKKRVNYIDPLTGEEMKGNTHSSCITYVPGRINKTAYFLELFQGFGKAVVPARRMK